MGGYIGGKTVSQYRFFSFSEHTQRRTHGLILRGVGRVTTIVFFPGGGGGYIHTIEYRV